MADQRQQIEQLKYALWLAIMQNKNEQIVQFFNSPKIEINVNVALTNQGITALHQAASNGNLNLVQFLVAIQKADIDQQDIFGRTPLHFACAIGNLAIVDYLIQSKASPNIQTIKGRRITNNESSPVSSIAIIILFNSNSFRQNQLESIVDEIINYKTKKQMKFQSVVNKLGQNVLHIFRISCVNSLEKQNQIYTPINDVMVELQALISAEGQYRQYYYYWMNKQNEVQTIQ